MLKNLSYFLSPTSISIIVGCMMKISVQNYKAELWYFGGIQYLLTSKQPAIANSNWPIRKYLDQLANETIAKEFLPDFARARMSSVKFVNKINMDPTDTFFLNIGPNWSSFLLITNTHEIDALNNASTLHLPLKIESMGPGSGEIRTLDLLIYYMTN